MKKKGKKWLKKKHRKQVRKLRKCQTSQLPNSKKLKKILRQGSKRVKKMLLESNPRCDICGSKDNLQLHHIYLIRHGFRTEVDRCTLLCEHCHKKFHKKFDKYLDFLYSQNPETDFLSVYHNLKTFL